MVETAQALHAFILSESLKAGSPEKKLAAVSMSGFYDQCGPEQKALIQKMGVVAFCEANSLLLRYSDEVDGRKKGTIQFYCEGTYYKIYLMTR